MNDAKRRNRHLESALATAALAVTLLWAAPSQAIPEYAQTIADTYGICVPQCTLCHQTLQGGAGTVDSTKPFYVSMAAQGLRPGASPDAIPGMLMALDTADTNVDGTPDGDSDGDTVMDTVELAAEENPNEPGPGQLCGGPRYGCGARIARGRNVEASGLSAALGAAALFAWVRRRRRLFSAG